MAGYIFSLGKERPSEIYRDSALNGVFSTTMSTLSSIPFEGTLADYATMQQGDNIYFFYSRRLYGIGTLKNMNDDCKYCNYPHSCKEMDFPYEEIQNNLLDDSGEESMRQRWICTFLPDPYFFQKGIDMDEVLSYKPITFKVLRTFWKASFIKIGDEENQSLKEIILLRNQEALVAPSAGNTYYFSDQKHQEICSKITENHKIQICDLLSSCNRNGKITHEMAIEAATLNLLSSDKGTVLGTWDYLSHQVPASPFKPIDYMDRMDVFGYRYLEGTKIISKYLVIEIKRDMADLEAVKQVAKYVDWICREYAYGDYSSIEGYVLAYSFTSDAILHREEGCKRTYANGSHPIENKEWDFVKLIKYSFSDEQLHFTEQL